MQEAIAAALGKQDFQTAAALLKQWQAKEPKNPTLWLMVGQYQEATGRWEQAEKTYLKVLRLTPSQKLMGQARQGIQRVQRQIAQAREEVLEMARAEPDGMATGVLCLEPVQGTARKRAAQGLASLLGTDVYTASLQLPSRGWRLYRVGPFGDLQVYGQGLLAAEIPAFWYKLADITALQVFSVDYFRQVDPHAEVICRNAQGQVGAIAFQWSEVSQMVMGQLPLFESVVDVGAWRQLKRREATQDYAEVIDLHFHQRRCLLRLCDRTYSFQQGNPLPNAAAIPDQALSTRPQWQALMCYLRERVNAPRHDNFTHFGTGALELMNLLPFMDSHLNLSRIKETLWDPAFHLYSGLHYLRSR